MLGVRLQQSLKLATMDPYIHIQTAGIN